MKKVIKKLYYLLYEMTVKIKSINGNKKIEQLKDSHKGERCFIVCTGPSLTINDLELIKNEFSISMNSIINVFDKTSYRPNIYMIQDPFVFKNLYQGLFEKINGVDLKFIGSFIKYKYPNTKIPRDLNVYNLSLLNHNLLDNSDVRFSNDFSRIVYDGFSVTYSAVQLAVYMGFKDIYFLGNDCNYFGKKKHFDGSMETFIYDNTAENMQIAYRYLNKAKNINTNIFNSTRGGSLEVFPRVSLEEVLQKKREDN